MENIYMTENEGTKAISMQIYGLEDRDKKWLSQSKSTNDWYGDKKMKESNLFGSLERRETVKIQSIQEHVSDSNTSVDEHQSNLFSI